MTKGRLRRETVNRGIIIVNEANAVGAQGFGVDRNGVKVFVSFRIDRVTGKTSVVGCYGDWLGGKCTTVAWAWDLICQPARRLF
jgi:hypothetical protein